MVEINTKDLVKLGEGPCHVGNKLYAPKTVIDHLDLSPNARVEYFVILDSKCRDMIVIKKKS